MNRRQQRWAASAGVLLATLAFGFRPAESRPAQLTPGEEKIVQALQGQARCEFIETPLADVIEFLAALHHIPIQLDERALAEAKIKTTTPVTRNIRGVSLHGSLRLILRPLGLVHVIHQGKLLITTPEEGRQRLQRGAVPPAAYVSPTALADARKQTEATLGKPVDIAFIETPLKDVAMFLNDTCDAKIHIDERGLAAAKVAADTPCTVSLKHVSLRAALDQVVGRLGLSYVVEDEYVLITGPKKNAKTLPTEGDVPKP